MVEVAGLAPAPIKHLCTPDRWCRTGSGRVMTNHRGDQCAVVIMRRSRYHTRSTSAWRVQSPARSVTEIS